MWPLPEILSIMDMMSSVKSGRLLLTLCFSALPIEIRLLVFLQINSWDSLTWNQSVTSTISPLRVECLCWRCCARHSGFRPCSGPWNLQFSETAAFCLVWVKASLMTCGEVGWRVPRCHRLHESLQSSDLPYWALDLNWLPGVLWESKREPSPRWWPLLHPRRWRYSRPPPPPPPSPCILPHTLSHLNSQDFHWSTLWWDTLSKDLRTWDWFMGWGNRVPGIHHVTLSPLTSRPRSCCQMNMAFFFLKLSRWWNLQIGMESRKTGSWHDAGKKSPN